MGLPTTDLRLLVGRAGTLSERLTGNFLPLDDDTALARDRLARWKKLAAADDPERFAAVLAAHGVPRMSEDELLSRLGAVRFSSDNSLPTWAITLSQLVESIEQNYREGGPDLEVPSHDRRREDVPFQSLYRPIGRFAWRQVERTTPSAGLLGDKARLQLQRHLLRRISQVASVPLHARFLAHRAIRQAGMFPHVPSRSEETAGESEVRPYNDFVLGEGQEGMRAFFLRYPVAARLVAELMQHWVEFVCLFLRHLAADRYELSGCFNANLPLGEVTDIQVGVSDPHQGGKSVLVLTFRKGWRIVYKPRSLEVDQRFFELAQSLALGRTLDQRSLRICPRGSYGWMEFAAHAACTNKVMAGRYYQRAGALTCLVHWLQGIDCHRHNLIAAGEHPVLVDLEALAHPRRLGETITKDGSSWQLANSVLRTGLLPMWVPHPTKPTFYESSGLDAPVTERSLFPVVRWSKKNTADMAWRYNEHSRRSGSHRARLGNKTLSLREFEPQFLRGYRRAAANLEGAKADQFQTLREAIYGLPRRHIKRPTLLYGMMIQRSLTTQNLTDGVDRSIGLHALPCGDDNMAEWLAEIVSLEALDIPYLHVNPQESHTEERTAGSVPHVRLDDQEEPMRLAVRRKAKLAGEMISPTGD